MQCVFFWYFVVYGGNFAIGLICFGGGNEHCCSLYETIMKTKLLFALIEDDIEQCFLLVKVHYF